MKTKWGLLLAISQFMALVFSSASAFAQYDSYQLGSAAGAFIGATYMYEALGRSPCSYALRSTPSVTGTISEVRRVLNTQDQKELDAFLASAEFKNESRRFEQGFIYESLKEGRTSGVDEKTICGAILAIIVQHHSAAKRDWEAAKNRVNR